MQDKQKQAKYKSNIPAPENNKSQNNTIKNFLKDEKLKAEALGQMSLMKEIVDFPLLSTLEPL